MPCGGRLPIWFARPLRLRLFLTLLPPLKIRQCADLEIMFAFVGLCKSAKSIWTFIICYVCSCLAGTSVSWRRRHEIPIQVNCCAKWNEKFNTTLKASSTRQQQAQPWPWTTDSTDSNATGCGLPVAGCLLSTAVWQLTSPTTNRRPSSILDLCQAALLAAIACCMPLALRHGPANVTPLAWASLWLSGKRGGVLRPYDFGTWQYTYTYIFFRFIVF